MDTMEAGDIIRGVTLRNENIIFTGEIVHIKESSYVVSNGSSREMIRKENVELISKRKIIEKRCSQCGAMQDMDNFRNLKNQKKDKVCKSCRAIAIRDGKKKERESHLGKKVEDLVASVNKECQSMESNIEMINEEVKRCVRVGKGFIDVDFDSEKACLSLNPMEATNFQKADVANQVAEDYGGTVAELVSQVFIRVPAK